MKALAAVVAVLLTAVVASAQELPIGAHVGNNVPGDAAPGSSYDDGGRRDPFVTLLVPKKAAPTPSASVRPKAGLAGVSLADVSVRGIVHNGAVVVALLEGPGGRSFVARSKDRLQDATIKSIDADGVTFAQQVIDAVGTAHARDIRKSLRQMPVEDNR